MQDQDSIYFSKEGLLKLKGELETLKTKKRKEIADRLEYAKSLGDLSENSEYQEAKESQILNESKIAESEDMLRRAVVVERTLRDTANIGSQVLVEAQNGSRTNFFIVGSKEAAPGENKISHESPLGQALLGHKKFESVSVQTPKGVAEYKILDIQ